MRYTLASPKGNSTPGNTRTQNLRRRSRRPVAINPSAGGREQRACAAGPSKQRQSGPAVTRPPWASLTPNSSPPRAGAGKNIFRATTDHGERGTVSSTVSTPSPRESGPPHLYVPAPARYHATRGSAPSQRYASTPRPSAGHDPCRQTCPPFGVQGVGADDTKGTGRGRPRDWGGHAAAAAQRSRRRCTAALATGRPMPIESPQRCRGRCPGLTEKDRWSA